MSLDNFTDISGWLPVASGLAKLTLASDAGPSGRALRLDFDFGAGGGFVVARKQMAVSLPETWALCFALRGLGPQNHFELKLSDPSGRNVWWYRKEGFALPADWRSMRIRNREIEFAWGPAGGGAPTDLGAIELALAAGPGGRGSLWIADLQLEDLSARARPRVSASSALPGHAADGLFDTPPPSSWRSERVEAPASLTIDFQREREYGGLVIDWEPDGRARSFGVATSNDGVTWEAVHATTHADAARAYVSMPGTSARYLRLALEASVAGHGFGIAALGLRPFEFSRTIQTFFRGVAADAARGDYPRYLVGEQSYWTPVGVPDGETCALINEEGMVEVDRGTFSIEPFLYAHERLLTWADVAVTLELEDGALPIPSVSWRSDGATLRTTAFALRCAGRPLLFIRYRVENTGPAPTSLRLFAALRPFQVNPPWQAFEGLGGVRAIHELAGTAHRVRVDDERSVIVLGGATSFGAATFDQGNVTDHLRRGDVPPRSAVRDGFGHAAGALRFDVDLAPGATSEAFLAIPFGTIDADAPFVLPDGIDGAAAFAAAVQLWTETLAVPRIDLGPAGQAYVDTQRTAVGHVLVERDGPALQPGPRRYTRSWVRDGAIMAAALLRAGRTQEACAFARWYAGHQAADGYVPCVVDRKGVDWLVEHDSHGELIFVIAECFRFTRDRSLLDELWPAVERAALYIERLRERRLGPQWDEAARRACRGLLPESASHEGYLAHPVHAYWDDFWAVRGLGDAAYLATARGDAATATRLTALRDAFRASVQESLALTIASRAIPYVPGSVEWADFDPTATSNAISLLGETPLLPPSALAATFAEYLAGFRRRRRDEIDWANYTAYEVRIVGALVHLGERASAVELADFLLSDRRPLAWNQWPEISWRDPRSPGHIGDVPHAWIAAEYVLAFRTMLAYERMADEALVIAAGVPPAWLEGGAAVTVDAFPTYFGSLGYTLRRRDPTTLTLTLRGDFAVPPGGIVLRPPLAGGLAAVMVDGVPLAELGVDEVVLRQRPVEVVLQHRSAS
jgi:F5/8 type C domain-containing protein